MPYIGVLPSGCATLCYMLDDQLSLKPLPVTHSVKNCLIYFFGLNEEVSQI